MWLGPPSMNRKITRFARAGKWPLRDGLLVSNLGSIDGAAASSGASFSMADSTRAPNPPPPRRRASRRVDTQSGNIDCPAFIQQLRSNGPDGPRRTDPRPGYDTG